MEKKFSIIIPVYNAMTSGGGFIERCVKSVLEQKNFTLGEVEILLINDGSQDKSLQELKRIEKSVPDIIRVIDQKNIGVAKTRNKGVSIARGEYTIFLDQDDWIDEDFLATYYSYVQEKKYDVIIGGYRRPNSKGKVAKTQAPVNESFYRYVVIAAWAKIHRTSFLRENNIEFFNNPYGEDLPFTCLENLKTDSYKIVPYIGYNWYMNEKSVSNTSQKSLSVINTDDFLKLLVKLRELQQSMDAEKNNEYSYMLLRTSIYFILFSIGSSTKYEFEYSSNALMNWMYDNVPDLLSSKGKIKYPQFPSGEKWINKNIVASFIFMQRTNRLKVVGTIGRLLKHLPFRDK